MLLIDLNSVSLIGLDRGKYDNCNSVALLNVIFRPILKREVPAGEASSSAHMASEHFWQGHACAVLLLATILSNPFLYKLQ